MTAGRNLTILAFAFVASCGTPPVHEPAELEFASRLMARTDVGGNPARAAAAAEPAPPAVRGDFAPLPAKTRADEWSGLVEVPADRLADLERAAADDASLAGLVAAPIDIHDLAALAVLRAPEVKRARAQYEAARTAYAQSEDLGDLVGLYRSFTRDTNTRVGPERSRRSTEMIAPAPNVDGISSEIAARTAEMAFNALRATIRDVVAQAWSAHADAARLDEARRIVREEVELDQVLLDVLRSRLESGTGSQAGFLAFESRLERLRTELAILDRQETVVRADWNRLLSRPESAEVVLAVAPEPPVSVPAVEVETSIVQLALAERQELRSALLGAERAELGVRLAETMTLPRLDVGSSRFERERAGEAGAQRGAVFPRPGRMIMPRSDFGVREAQVQEMRSRSVSMHEKRDALHDRVRTETRQALFAVDAADRRLRVHDDSIVPLARKSLDAARGAYEGNRTGYLDLLDAVRRLLDARLGLADARRMLVYSQAALLRAVGVKGVDRR